MLFRYEIVALAIALTVSSAPIAVACEPGASAIGLPQLTSTESEAIASGAAADALEPARFVRLDEDELFSILTASFAAPEDTTGSILLPGTVDSPALDGWEDR